MGWGPDHQTPLQAACTGNTKWTQCYFCGLFFCSFVCFVLTVFCLFWPSFLCSLNCFCFILRQRGERENKIGRVEKSGGSGRILGQRKIWSVCIVWALILKMRVEAQDIHISEIFVSKVYRIWLFIGCNAEAMRGRILNTLVSFLWWFIKWCLKYYSKWI